MIEILLYIVIAFVIMLVLGVSVETVIFMALCLLEFSFVLVELFFVFSFIVLLLSKRKNALFKKIDANEKNEMIKHAYYDVDGIMIHNMYPVDTLSRKIFYRQEEEIHTVHVMKTKKGHFLLDGCCLCVMTIGIVVFSVLIAFTTFILIFGI